MSHLIVWRHGETAWNAARRVQGHADVELSAVGRAQAAAAAERLATLRPAAIVASDLRRAAETAGALAALTGLDVRYDVRLRERYYGPWQGCSTTEIAERWPVEYARWRAGESVIGLGIEARDDLSKRASAALADAVAGAEVAAAEVAGAEAAGAASVDAGAAHPTVVVVTHGGTARQGCWALLGWPEPVIRTVAILGNCRWTELRSDPVRGWQLIAHNGA